MKNNTTWTSATDVKRNWYVFDASEAPLGRMAVSIARLLMGKNTVNYSSNLDMGHNVIVINCEKIKLTGQKLQYLDIRHYTGYQSGLKKEPLKDLIKTNPTKIILTAIKGMLPDSKLKDKYIAKLHLVIGSTHKYEAQKPVKMTVK